jgi:hypothetical protein
MMAESATPPMAIAERDGCGMICAPFAKILRAAQHSASVKLPTNRQR